MWVTEGKGFFRVTGCDSTWVPHAYLSSSNDHTTGAPPLVKGLEWTGARCLQDTGAYPFELSFASIIVTVACIFDPLWLAPSQSQRSNRAVAAAARRSRFRIDEDDDEDDDEADDDGEDAPGDGGEEGGSATRELWWIESSMSEKIMNLE